ncbi:MAG: hypothetical protein AAGA93_06725 [Actinomycetota bacterium]
MDWPAAHRGDERAMTMVWLVACGVAVALLTLGVAGYLLLRDADGATVDALDDSADFELESAAETDDGAGIDGEGAASGPADGRTAATTPEGPTSSVVSTSSSASVASSTTGPSTSPPGGESTTVSTAPSTTPDNSTTTEVGSTTTAPGPTTSTTVAPSTSSRRPTTATTTDGPGTRPAAEYPDPMAASGPAGSGCSVGAGSLPDGVWFGFLGGWTDPSIGFDVVCLYGGATATSLADRRHETMEPGRAWYAVDDDGYNTRTIPVAATARAAEIVDANGNTGPPVPWADVIADLDLVDGVRSLMAWVHVEDGLVVDVAATPWSLVHPSLVPREPVFSRCRNNGLHSNTRLEVFGVPVDRDGGRIPVTYEPDPDAPVQAWLENGSIITLVFSCEIVTGDTVWWGVDYEGAVAWTLAEFLRLR